MARQALDENESGAYTGDGGTSNNGKVNANFTELYNARSYYGLTGGVTTRANPTTWTAFAGKATLPAARAQAGDILRVHYLLSASGGTAGQFEYRVKLGGVELCASGALTGIDDGGNVAGMFDMRVRTGGVSSVLDIGPHNAKRGGAGEQTVPLSGDAAVSGPDLTAACDLTIETQFGTTDAGNTTSLLNVGIEVIRP